ncbi:unnamed protein product [Arctogadus glacialis]
MGLFIKDNLWLTNCRQGLEPTAGRVWTIQVLYSRQGLDPTADRVWNPQQTVWSPQQTGSVAHSREGLDPTADRVWSPQQTGSGGAHNRQGLEDSTAEREGLDPTADGVLMEEAEGYLGLGVGFLELDMRNETDSQQSCYMCCIMSMLNIKSIC